MQKKKKKSTGHREMQMTFTSDILRFSHVVSYDIFGTIGFDQKQVLLTKLLTICPLYSFGAFAFM